MSKKTVFFIFLSFLLGFLLKSCLQGPLVNINLNDVARQLKGGDSSSVIAEGKPILRLEKVEIPKTVRAGESFTMNVYFKPLRRIDGNYKMFVHVYTGARSGWINADRRPIPATHEWPPNTVTKIGPIQIFIPEDNPSGRYKIELGLFKGEKTSDGARFVRLPYVNLRGHVVGKIKVLKARKITEESVFNALRKQARAFGYEDYFIGVDSCMKKVARELVRFSSPLSDTVKISLAKNEYEAAQIIIVPYKKNLENIEIAVSDLQDAKGNVIASENIRVNLVGYVATGAPDYPTAYIGYWPDPLLDAEPFSVVVGEVQPVWLRFYAPDTTVAGTYTGTITISADNAKERKLNVEIRVFDFALPVKGHLKTAFDLYTLYISRYYNVHGADFKYMLYKYWDAMLEHRISPIYAALTPRIRRRTEGVAPIDFSEFDTDLAYCLQRGLTAFGIGPYGGSYDNHWGSSTQVKAVFTQYLEHLEPSGLLDMAYVYAYDEPSFAKAGAVKRVCKTVHSVSKKIKTLLTREPYERFGPDVDIWCPHIIYYRHDACQKEKEKGKEIWWYVSSQRPGVPGFNIDIPGIDNRIVFWMNWKFEVEGLLYWAVNRWGKKNPYETAEIYSHQNGNGYLFYPGDDGPVDSIRVELIRDGIDDYEYFYILNSYVEALEKQGISSSAVSQAKKLLALDDIITSVDEYTKDPALLLKRRRAIAEAIEKMKGVL